MIEDYLNSKKVNGASERTIETYESLLKGWNKYKPLDQWEKKDVSTYILKMKDAGKRPATIEGNKIILKNFFNWANKPDYVKDIQIKKISNALDKNDILTPEDVNKLIETTASPMYKALIAFLFESGARISEILRVRVSDCIEDENKGLIVSVHQTKTGKDFRRVLCVSSGQYIRNHITHSVKSKDDLLFDLTNVSVWEMLKKIGKKAGIDKPISAHKFRHAEATLMVQQGYNEAIIRKKLGWSPSSTMIARYQHLDDDDVINATHEMRNQGRTEEEIKKEIERIRKQRQDSIKTVDPLKLADNESRYAKMEEENEALKARLDKRDEDMEIMKRQMELITAALAAKQQA